MNPCSSCGQPLPVGANICPNCGHQVGLGTGQVLGALAIGVVASPIVFVFYLLTGAQITSYANGVKEHAAVAILLMLLLIALPLVVIVIALLAFQRRQQFFALVLLLPAIAMLLPASTCGVSLLFEFTRQLVR